MRLTARLVSALLVVTGCSAPTNSPPGTTATSVPDGPIRGVLPDGTVYDVILEPVTQEEVTDVTAGVLAGDEVREVTFRKSDGGWSAEMGPEPLDVMAHLGLPVVELPPPLQWADDDQAPMQVTYETFAVRRGCNEMAVACNPTQAVQALPLEEISPGAPRWSADQATVVSYTLRRPSNRHYIDPGPLGGQSGHDLLWTGEEMIVWGGAAPPRVEGAAFDPGTDTWRMLSPAPLDDRQVTRAVWADTQMIVLSEAATVAYDPASDSWTRIGAGADPPPDPGPMVWTGEEVVAWTGKGIQRLADRAWEDLGGPQPEGGVLRVVDGRLLAVGPDACEARVIREWTGEQWQEVTAPPEHAGGCPLPEQTAAVDGRLVVWRDDSHPTFVYDPSRDHWKEVDPIPLRSTDRPSGPVVMANRFLVTRGPEGAIFDPATNDWQPVELPGHGTDATMVWTGEEVLMWNRCCYEPDDVDAWRWAPPPSMPAAG